MTSEVPQNLRGKSVEEAREETVLLLRVQEYLEKVEPHIHSVGHCYKCGTVIQPLLRKQWFVKMKPLAEPAIKALQENQIQFYPSSKRQQLIDYLENLRDWNISRQIAWGIAIPAFQNENDPDDWIFDERTDQENIVVGGKTYRRDPEVFDTWFSSASWPYVTLDFPDGDDYKKYYPLSLMETGGEILYPWVSRMLMFGLYTTGKVPFKEVYIHGYVMAEDGSKMSKSIGNIVDAEKEIDKFGADALRMGLLAGRVAGVNRPYDQRRVEEARNLANKLWNVCRYSYELVANTDQDKPAEKSIADHYILNRLSIINSELTKDLSGYRLSEAYERLYHFIWDDLADWYIEVSKITPNPRVLKQVIEQTLKLAHPLAPFVTESIWQQLNWQNNLLTEQDWPEQKLDYDQSKAGQFEEMQSLIRQIRQIASQVNINKLALTYHRNETIEQNELLIKTLARLVSVSKTKQGQGLKLPSQQGQIWLELSPEQLSAYETSLSDQLSRVEVTIRELEKRLGNKSYRAKAPKELVQESEAQLGQQIETAKQLKQSLSELK